MSERVQLHRISTAALLRALGGPHKRCQLQAALALGRGGIVGYGEIVEFLYGDDPDGGPLWPAHVVGVYVYELRRAGARIENHPWRGYSLR
jgi:hypothetical protein